MTFCDIGIRLKLNETKKTANEIYKLDETETKIIDTESNKSYDIKEVCELLNDFNDELIKHKREHYRLVGILQDHDEYIKQTRRF